MQPKPTGGTGLAVQLAFSVVVGRSVAINTGVRRTPTLGTRLGPAFVVAVFVFRTCKFFRVMVISNISGAATLARRLCYELMRQGFHK